MVRLEAFRSFELTAMPTAAPPMATARLEESRPGAGPDCPLASQPRPMAITMLSKVVLEARTVRHPADRVNVIPPSRSPLGSPSAPAWSAFSETAPAGEALRVARVPEVGAAARAAGGAAGPAVAATEGGAGEGEGEGPLGGAGEEVGARAAAGALDADPPLDSPTPPRRGAASMPLEEVVAIGAVPVTSSLGADVSVAGAAAAGATPAPASTGAGTALTAPGADRGEGAAATVATVAGGAVAVFGGAAGAAPSDVRAA